ncbi:Uncharacterised protein [Mycobacterium tuberculosis]|uniref:Uncharacterized protein n=1 Tax=Mycobacterium tuberculosis TaxID=1773 RepID=A0A655FYB1_MYCTX|nr:Uncharacterised protein [Mycobacterium tuberculosis]CFE78166.1 Uncharacterised protein [Mycobacterium tuberculosis]CFR95825.1 Uncharacterised protein [Mycobacterium tuberculosis]CFS54780.1 Uncharacterised protein [Mycobacterium tuberculosis]CNV81715.1 Uncharacterised protein [Mycobacterium tuberculosis]
MNEANVNVLNNTTNIVRRYGARGPRNSLRSK